MVVSREVRAQWRHGTLGDVLIFHVLTIISGPRRIMVNEHTTVSSPHILNCSTSVY